jgi:hypothetical protein
MMHVPALEVFVHVVVAAAAVAVMVSIQQMNQF